MTDDDIVTGILKREGGYVDRADDRGGPTSRGITIPTLIEWRGHAVTAADVRALTEAEARAIYLGLYINKPGFARIPDARLRELVVDTGVHSGQRHAAEWLQKILGVRQDGVLGPKTMAVLATTPVLYVYLGLCALRMRILGRLITRDRSQASNAAGWMDRIAGFVERTPTHP